MKNIFQWKPFITITLITSIWINISEVFRYFILVMPHVKGYWNDVKHIADMNWIIFSIWGLWDTLLTAMVVFLFWLYSRLFGNTIRSIFAVGTLAWLFFFVLYWVGVANMGYSDWSILMLTLPLSLLELIIAAWIAAYLYKKYDNE